MVAGSSSANGEREREGRREESRTERGSGGGDGMLVDGDWGELREQIGHQEGYMGWLVGWAFLSVLSFFFSSLLFFFSFLFLFFPSSVLLLWVSSLAYPNLLGTKGYVVVLLL
jgi:hypothetical protein